VGNNPLNYKDPYGLQAAPAVPIIIWITILVLVFTGYKTIQTCPPQQIPVFDWQSFLIPLLVFGGGGIPNISIPSGINGPLFSKESEPKGSHGRKKQSTGNKKQKHDDGNERRIRDQRGEKGDKNRPEIKGKRPKGHKGPWPPPQVAE
ncbi:MAG: hypothetical protein JNN05_06395, partial [Candidatus Omnitrophica bacterium]|nr:hypothetical protein [Candidatus Omnitrophota bacterium]